jgi:hypothetical protein
MNTQGEKTETRSPLPLNPFSESRKTVGASLLAMDPSAPRSSSSHALPLTTIAAMRRPDKPAQDCVHAESPLDS